MKRAITRALIGLGVAILTVWPGVAQSMERVSPTTSSIPRAHTPARVFVLHSFGEDDLWIQQMDAGILAALAEAGYSTEDGTLELNEYWLNAKYYTSRDYMVNIAAAAQRAIEQFEPDIVIATDDQAVKWVVAKWDDETLPFVFAGLNTPVDEIRGLSEHTNVTGVMETLFFGRTLDWIHYVLPDAESIVFLSDTSRKEETLQQDIEKGLAEHRGRVQASHNFQEVGVQTVDTFADWQEHVLQNQDADVLVVVSYLTLVDERGNKMDSTEVISWTVEHSQIPVVAMAEYSVIQGALGGMVVAGDEQGYLAGQLTARVLAGEAPSELDIVVQHRGKLVLNTQAIQRWHINVPISLLQVSTLYGPDGQVIR